MRNRIISRVSLIETMDRLTVFTTKEDLSLPFFFLPPIQEIAKIEIFLYENYIHGEALPPLLRGYIYLRDPFTASLPPEDMRPVLEALIQKKDGLIYVDNLSQIEDIYFEDKWRQYLLLSEFMPATSLFSGVNHPSGPLLYKKRISSRARGILFVQPKNDLGEYIEQERLNIKEEYRVIEVCKTILPDMLIKSPRTERQKVIIQKSALLPPDVRAFVSLIQKKHSYDLVGYDIARLSSGALYLIELNRSPQISAYIRKTSINPFEILLKILAKRD